MQRNYHKELNPRARITGTVYFLYFMTAVLGAYLAKHNFTTYGYIVNTISLLLYTAVTILFYYIFKPVNKYISLIAAFLSLLGCISTALILFLSLSIINPLVFFGLFCILIGYLILKSTFLPNILGALMVLAGIGWLIILTPFGNHISLLIKILGILAEASLMLWLIIMGVSVERWKEQAGAKEVNNKKESPDTK